MGLDLGGMRALVTGSSSGIGAGIAAYLANEGVQVAVHGRDADRTAEVARSIVNAGGKAVAVIGDIATDAGGDAVARAVNDAMGGIDILVNVAGGPGGTFTWDNTEISDWVDQYQLNTLSAVRMINHFLPGMKERGLGRIVQIASIAGIRPFPNQVPAYCASKAALIVTSLSLAMTVAGTGVTVNCITPGFIATQGLQDYVMNSPGNEGKQWDDIEAEVARGFKCAVGRLGKPEDIASMVAYLSSPHTSWITGSNFRIDGGTADWVG